MLFKLLLKNIIKGASVIFISSISSEQGSYDPFYSSSKAALNMMVKNLAKEFAKQMRIITVSPSLIKNTKMYFDMSKKLRKVHIKKNPQKSLVEKKDLAKILSTLCSEEWKKFNGANLNLNGGI
jgi:NAD(P)-dependent dehydrogenase (short-subunit alcohol dehydrogenase family)